MAVGGVSEFLCCNYSVLLSREVVWVWRTVKDVVMDVPSSIGEEVGGDGVGVCDGHFD